MADKDLARLARAGIAYPWDPRQSLRLLDILAAERVKRWRLQAELRRRGIVVEGS